MLSNNRTRRLIKKMTRASKLLMMEYRVVNQEGELDVLDRALVGMWRDEYSQIEEYTSKVFNTDALLGYTEEEEGLTLLLITDNLVGAFYDGKMALAKCHPDDIFDPDLGIAIAYQRLQLELGGEC